MKFDNAFLTKNGDVGMQFTEKAITYTVHLDAKGSMVVSEHATPEQKAKLVLQYQRRRGWYKK